MRVTNTCALVIREFPDELEIISELEDKRCLKGLMSLPQGIIRRSEGITARILIKKIKCYTGCVFYVEGSVVNVHCLRKGDCYVQAGDN